MSSVVSSVFGGSGNAAGQMQSPISAQQTEKFTGNVNQGLDQQQAFLQALQAQGGIGNQSQVFNQLQNVANGQGPNPAQAMLANSTGQNVANQAALMAGQRGSSANPALIARQAAMQGANTQQQAAGQGAALQAQQSLNAMGQMGNIAGQQVGQQQNALQNYTGQGLQGMGQGASAVANANQINSQAQQAQQAMQGQMLGSVMGAAGSLGSLIPASGAASSGAGGSLAGGGGAGPAGLASTAMMMAQGGPVGQGPQSHYGKMLCMAKGGKVPAMVSPGEQYLPPKAVEQVAEGKSSPLKTGERIPGKPLVPGNSYANDTVPKTLESGGIVIPNAVMQSANPEKSAKEFVSQVLARKGSLPKKK